MSKRTEKYENDEAKGVGTMAEVIWRQMASLTTGGSNPQIFPTHEETGAHV